MQKTCKILTVDLVQFSAFYSIKGIDHGYILVPYWESLDPGIAVGVLWPIKPSQKLFWTK